MENYKIDKTLKNYMHKNVYFTHESTQKIL